MRLGAALCPPYDVVSPRDAAALRRSAHNAARLEIPAGRGAGRFRGAAAIWRRWVRSGAVRKDRDESFYICEQSFRRQGRILKRLGLLAALSCADRRVIPHEKTLPKPRAERLALLKALRVNTSPIFGVVEDPGGRILRMLRARTRRRPDALGRARGESFRLWRVGGWPRLRAALRVREMLVADGHHRYEVARRSGARAVLAYVCSDADGGLVLLPTHRVARRAALDRAALRGCRMTSCASIAELERRLAGAKPLGFGLFDGRLWLVEPPPGGAPRGALSVEWVSARLLAGADAAKVVYLRGLAAAVSEARRRGAAAVLIPPLTVAQVRAAARRGGLLPPKTTYFHPKAPAGLVFRESTP